MANDIAADQRLRRRVTTIVGAGLSAVSVTSKRNADITFANRHYVTITPVPTVAGATVLTAGILSVRAEPVGSQSVGTAINNIAGYAPVGIEAINVNTATQLTFVVSGFFDAFMVNITTLVTGGTVTVVINSTIEN